MRCPRRRDRGWAKFRGVRWDRSRGRDQNCRRPCFHPSIRCRDLCRAQCLCLRPSRPSLACRRRKATWKARRRLRSRAMQLSSPDGWKPRRQRSCCCRRYWPERQESLRQEAPLNLRLGGRGRSQLRWTLHQESAEGEPRCWQSACRPRRPSRRQCCQCRLLARTARAEEERCWAGRELGPRKAQASADRCHRICQRREAERSHSKGASPPCRCDRHADCSRQWP